MTQYLQIYKKYTELQNKIKQDISAKEKEDPKTRTDNSDEVSIMENILTHFVD